MAADGTGLLATDSTQAGNSFSWSAIGPLPLTNEIPTFGGVALGGALAGVTGRVTAVVADSTVNGRLFVGTGDGGVWMRPSASATFVPIFDLEPTLSVGALALDTTTNPNPTLYVGSGEGNGSGDSYYGQGVFVSSNLGATWTQLGASNFAHASIASIAVDTTQTPRTIYAAVTYGSSASRADASWVAGDFSQNGLWRSGDGGASWIPYPAGTFGACPYFTNDPCPAESVAIDPASPTAVLVSILGVGVFRSSNAGFSWTPAEPAEPCRRSRPRERRCLRRHRVCNRRRGRRCRVRGILQILRRRRHLDRGVGTERNSRRNDYRRLKLE